MAGKSTNDRGDSVRWIFSRLAERYDLANRWMTWGQDIKWRGEVIDKAHLTAEAKLLDIGTGTGGLVLEARRRDKSLVAVGADFTNEMIQIGQNRAGGEGILWLNSDALYLPFGAETFDAAVCGFLLRNVMDVFRAIAEQYRVLKKGGRMVCLDTTPPPGDVWHLPERIYLRTIIPIIGGWVAGDRRAYRYLSESTAHFLKAIELAGAIQRAGFKEVGYSIFMGGTMAMHWGVK